MCYGAAPWCPISCFTFLSVDFRDLIPLMALPSAASAGSGQNAPRSAGILLACACAHTVAYSANRAEPHDAVEASNDLIVTNCCGCMHPARRAPLPAFRRKQASRRHPILRTGKRPVEWYSVHTSSPHLTVCASPTLINSVLTRPRSGVDAVAAPSSVRSSTPHAPLTTPYPIPIRPCLPHLSPVQSSQSSAFTQHPTTPIPHSLSPNDKHSPSPRLTFDLRVTGGVNPLERAAALQHPDKHQSG
jgi:hypothetical protein